MQVHVVASSTIKTEDVSHTPSHNDTSLVTDDDVPWRGIEVLLQRESNAEAYSSPTRNQTGGRIRRSTFWCGVCRRGGRSGWDGRRGGIAKTLLVELEERDSSATLVDLHGIFKMNWHEFDWLIFWASFRLAFGFSFAGHDGSTSGSSSEVAIYAIFLGVLTLLKDPEYMRGLEFWCMLVTYMTSMEALMKQLMERWSKGEYAATSRGEPETLLSEFLTHISTWSISASSQSISNSQWQRRKTEFVSGRPEYLTGRQRKQCRHQTPKVLISKLHD